MKKLLLLILLVAASVCAETNTIEQLAAWIAPRQLDEDEIRFYRFAVRSHNIIGGKRVRILYFDGSAIAKTPQMSNKIPRGRGAYLGWPDDQDFTLQDCALHTYLLPLNETLFTLCFATYGTPNSRGPSMTAAQFKIMVDEVLPFGIKESDILTDEEAKLVPRLEPDEAGIGIFFVLAMLLFSTGCSYSHVNGRNYFAIGLPSKTVDGDTEFCNKIGWPKIDLN